jgi:hypothetical protein
VAALDSFGFPSLLPEGIEGRAVHESGSESGAIPVVSSNLDDAVGFFGTSLPEEGVWWVSARAAGLNPGWDLPVVVGDEVTSLLRWGDLHWHSNHSDGSRSPHEGFRYARNVVGLDFTAKTDHDVNYLYGCMTERSWEETRMLADEYEDPGRFAVLLGWEWTNNLGHHNVYYRDLEGPYLPVPDYRTPEDLWAALPPGRALTIPHHPGVTGQPRMQWEHHDPRFQTVVEIFSNKGSSEVPIGPLMSFTAREDPEDPRPRRGSLQEGLSLGREFAIIASTDNHYALPGTPIRLKNVLTDEYPAGPGICAVWVSSLDRASLFDALAEGRTYGTTGPRVRIELESFDGETGGTGVRGRVIGTDTLRSVELVGIPKSGDPPFATVAEFEPGEDRRIALVHWEPDAANAHGPRADDIRGAYLRVTQEDSEMAWSSPAYFDSEH